MKDMKIDYKPGESSTMLGHVEDAEDHRPKYPYGLELHLNSESLKKLGIGPDQFPKIGSELMLHATLKVEGMGVSESANNKGPDSHMTLQITAMELEGLDKADPAMRMYGNT